MMPDVDKTSKRPPDLGCKTLKTGKPQVALKSRRVLKGP